MRDINAFSGLTDILVRLSSLSHLLRVIKLSAYFASVIASQPVQMSRILQLETLTHINAT